MMEAIATIATSIATTILVVGFLVLVHRCLDLGTEANEHRSAQLDAEHFKREAEEQRDAALAQVVVLQTEVGTRDDQLRQARELMEKTHAKLLATVDATADADLVALSRAVMSSLPDTSRAAASAAAPGAVVATPVRPAGTP